MTHSPMSVILATILLGGSLSSFAASAYAKDAELVPVSEWAQPQSRTTAPQAAALAQAAFARLLPAARKSEIPAETTAVKPRAEWFSDEGLTVSGGALRLKSTF